MRTCSICNARSADEIQICPNCGADLKVDSTTAKALAQLRANPRVRDIRLIIKPDACPVCLAAEGTYLKETAPSLPHDGCSCADGCTCHYEPMLNLIFP